MQSYHKQMKLLRCRWRQCFMTYKDQGWRSSTDPNYDHFCPIPVELNAFMWWDFKKLRAPMVSPNLLNPIVPLNHSSLYDNVFSHHRKEDGKDESML